jgi:hypothetical protein
MGNGIPESQERISMREVVDVLFDLFSVFATTFSLNL